METTASAFMSSDDVRIAFDDRGSGRPVVLIPGYSAPRRTFRVQADALVDAGFRAISVDLRHHGDSGFPEYGQRMSRQGQDIRELLEQLDLDDVVLVAHSMGVSACLAMFSVSGTARVGGLVAIEQSPRIMNDGYWRWGARGVTWDRVEAQARKQVSFGDGRGAGIVPPSHVLARIDVPHDAWQRFPHESVEALFISHWTSDWRDVLPRIDVPTLVVNGRFSPFYDEEGQRWFAGQIPGGRFSLYEQSAHAPHLEEPEAFNAELIRFVTR